MMLTDYICQEKNAEEGLLALKTALTDRYNSFKTIYRKAQMKTDHNR